MNKCEDWILRPSVLGVFSEGYHLDNLIVLDDTQSFYLDRLPPAVASASPYYAFLKFLDPSLLTATKLSSLLRGAFGAEQVLHIEFDEISDSEAEKLFWEHCKKIQLQMETFSTEFCAKSLYRFKCELDAVLMALESEKRTGKSQPVPSIHISENLTSNNAQRKGEKIENLDHYIAQIIALFTGDEVMMEELGFAVERNVSKEEEDRSLKRESEPNAAKEETTDNRKIFPVSLFAKCCLLQTRAVVRVSIPKHAMNKIEWANATRDRIQRCLREKMPNIRVFAPSIHTPLKHYRGGDVLASASAGDSIEYSVQITVPRSLYPFLALPAKNQISTPFSKAETTFSSTTNNNPDVNFDANHSHKDNSGGCSPLSEPGGVLSSLSLYRTKEFGQRHSSSDPMYRYDLRTAEMNCFNQKKSNDSLPQEDKSNFEEDKSATGSLHVPASTEEVLEKDLKYKQISLKTQCKTRANSALGLHKKNSETLLSRDKKENLVIEGLTSNFAAAQLSRVSIQEGGLESSSNTLRENDDLIKDEINKYEHHAENVSKTHNEKKLSGVDITTKSCLDYLRLELLFTETDLDFLQRINSMDTLKKVYFYVLQNHLQKKTLWNIKGCDTILTQQSAQGSFQELHNRFDLLKLEQNYLGIGRNNMISHEQFLEKVNEEAVNTVLSELKQTLGLSEEGFENFSTLIVRTDEIVCPCCFPCRRNSFLITKALDSEESSDFILQPHHLKDLAVFEVVIKVQFHSGSALASFAAMQSSLLLYTGFVMVPMCNTTLQSVPSSKTTNSDPAETFNSTTYSDQSPCSSGGLLVSFGMIQSKTCNAVSNYPPTMRSTIIVEGHPTIRYILGVCSLITPTDVHSLKLFYRDNPLCELLPTDNCLHAHSNFISRLGRLNQSTIGRLRLVLHDVVFNSQKKVYDRRSNVQITIDNIESAIKSIFLLFHMQKSQKLQNKSSVPKKPAEIHVTKELDHASKSKLRHYASFTLQKCDVFYVLRRLSTDREAMYPIRSNTRILPGDRLCVSLPLSANISVSRSLFNRIIDNLHTTEICIRNGYLGNFLIQECVNEAGSFSPVNINGNRFLRPPPDSILYRLERISECIVGISATGCSLIIVGSTLARVFFQKSFQQVLNAWDSLMISIPKLNIQEDSLKYSIEERLLLSDDKDVKSKFWNMRLSSHRILESKYNRKPSHLNEELLERTNNVIQQILSNHKWMMRIASATAATFGARICFLETPKLNEIAIDINIIHCFLDVCALLLCRLGTLHKYFLYLRSLNSSFPLILQGIFFSKVLNPNSVHLKERIKTINILSCSICSDMTSNVGLMKHCPIFECGHRLCSGCYSSFFDANINCAVPYLPLLCPAPLCAPLMPKSLSSNYKRIKALECYPPSSHPNTNEQCCNHIICTSDIRQYFDQPRMQRLIDASLRHFFFQHLSQMKKDETLRQTTEKAIDKLNTSNGPSGLQKPTMLLTQTTHVTNKNMNIDITWCLTAGCNGIRKKNKEQVKGISWDTIRSTKEDFKILDGFSILLAPLDCTLCDCCYKWCYNYANPNQALLRRTTNELSTVWQKARDVIMKDITDDKEISKLKDTMNMMPMRRYPFLQQLFFHDYFEDSYKSIEGCSHHRVILLLLWCFRSLSPLRTTPSFSSLRDNLSNLYQNGDLMVRDCPRCQLSVQRDQGCSHMTCPNCQGEFCWICGEDITGSHFDHYASSSCQLLDNPSLEIDPMNIPVEEFMIDNNGRLNRRREGSPATNDTVESPLDSSAYSAVSPLDVSQTSVAPPSREENSLGFKSVETLCSEGKMNTSNEDGLEFYDMEKDERLDIDKDFFNKYKGTDSLKLDI